MNRSTLITIGIVFLFCLGVIGYVRSVIPTQSVELEALTVGQEGLAQEAEISCVPSDVFAVGAPTPDALFAESLVPESYESSFLKGLFASKLVDGKSTTLAYPGSTEIDYVVRFSDGAYVINEVTVSWGSYGSRSLVDKWFLEGCRAEGDWVPLASGVDVTDEVEETSVDGGRYSALRLRASGDEWIGVYELELR
ncbi:MAG: hypothetical protein COU33_02160 [Candidatus Magasanikbacteria bacterium CG10_big_fil_rev_8_21_14_0_10_43_6]|uniref:Uncharacterized protein n=1 Tax=Candidatus Magasanikbacteria bacterium CG10_big_fil_rev_8_21_14_0_10_43_6 TaxID=1974650 RepID=A0A2M6W1C6_9BACT|nr:MAG: hypothetical protein COU33_02160 [Candidatus Magasanikbacteria bacterium CG10_big_fil_rev_8_21_14_0_10_43_6]